MRFLLFITLTSFPLFVCCSQSKDEIFMDVILGPLRPAVKNYPFLQLADSKLNSLVYPNRRQMISLVSDALNDEINMTKQFEWFETFRRFLREYLNGNYRKSSSTTAYDVPSGTRIEKQEYSFTAFVLAVSKLDDLATEMVGRVNLSNSTKNAMEEIRTCQSEKLGNTGISEVKVWQNGSTEFNRHRINCMRIKDNVFVAIGRIHMMFGKISQDHMRIEGNLQRTMEEYADYMLRKNISKNYDYPYLLEFSDQYWTATPAPPIVILQRPGIKGENRMIFYGGLNNNQQIIVHGIPTKDMFSVNLRQKDGLINLHISVRFNENRGVVVLNTLDRRTWYTEQRDGGFPFKRNVPFELKIKREDPGYWIEVDNQPFTFYRHILKAELVNFVTVEGDVINVTVADVLLSE